MKSAPHSRKFASLRAALNANALFSLTTGLGLACFSNQLAPILTSGVPPVLLGVIGAALVPFGAGVAWLGTRQNPETMVALFVSLADLGWVAGSAIVLILAPAHLTPLGIGAVVAVALCVLGFALGQLRGIARAYGTAGGSARFLVCFDVVSNGSADLIWRNLCDLGGIARFAPMLAASTLRDGTQPGPGAIRDCADRSGRRWSERCAALDHGQMKLMMEFLTHEPGFPFPFAEMTGGWSVKPTASGSQIQVWWEGRAKYPRLNGLVMPLLAWQARRQFPVIVKNLSGQTSADGTHSMIPAIAPC